MSIGWPLARNVIRGRILNNSFGKVRNQGTKNHQGWDLEAAVGTPCFAVGDGTIAFIDDVVDGLGKHVALGFTHEGRTLYAVYAHLSKIDVAKGQTVRKGQQVGLTGTSGNAIGMTGKQTHLHFEIRTEPRLGKGLAGRLNPKDVYHAFPLTEAILADSAAAAVDATPAAVPVPQAAVAGAPVPAAISGKGWEIYIKRHTIQLLNGETRTVGNYQVYHDGQPQTTFQLGQYPVPLFGQTAEPKGPGQNAKPATTNNPSRIKAGAYPLATQAGGMYVTYGYRPEPGAVVYPLPGIELLNTGKRTEILIHPGKNNFISSIGCINLCTLLDEPEEIITFTTSRRRVIALIEDMKAYLGGRFPGAGGKAIPDAQAVIEGEP